MPENLDKWPSKRGPISKIRPSDGCGRDAVLLMVERWYDFPEFGGYLGNVGSGCSNCGYPFAWCSSASWVCNTRTLTAPGERHLPQLFNIDQDIPLQS